MFNNIDMEHCGVANSTTKPSPLVESDNNIIEVSLNKKKICGRIQKVSLKNRVQDVADYITLKYPSIINGSVKMSDPRIIDICKEVFKTNNIKKLSNDLVKALSESLRCVNSLEELQNIICLQT